MERTIKDLYEKFGNEATDEMIAAYRIFRSTRAKFDAKGPFSATEQKWPTFADVEEKWLAFTEVCEKYGYEYNTVAYCIMSTTVADTMRYYVTN